MKKTVSVIVIFTMCALLFAGCGRKDETLMNKLGTDLTDKVETAKAEAEEAKQEEEAQNAKKEKEESVDAAEHADESEADANAEEVVPEEPEEEQYVADPYWGILLKYREAQDGRYTEEQVLDMGLQTELIQYGWPYAIYDDQVRYLYYDVNDDGWIELIITYYNDVIDIYSHDGDAVYSYGTPYRGIATMYPDGILQELFSYSASQSRETWFQYDVDSGKYLKLDEEPDVDGMSPVTLPEGTLISELDVD